ncbi:MAG: DUF4476 domain-containing protein [Cytophagales bacterium]
MKKIILSCLVIMFQVVFSQETRTVDAKGLGVGREDALQDALRNAVGQAAGVVLSSSTTVENYMVIQDAIATNTKGYINRYDVLNEKKIQDGYEINVRAVVSTTPIKADFNLLSRSVGGIRFMVAYDTRNVKPSEKADYDFVVDQINNFFASKKYRYIDRSRFLALQQEAIRMMEEQDTSGVSYSQQLGLLADAQFIVQIKNIRRETVAESFNTRNRTRVVIDAQAFDNCTAEGLGNITLEGDWENSSAPNFTVRTGISSAVKKDFNELILTFTSYIGNWVNNGTPFELRFYSTGTFRDLRELRNKLKSDPSFGGEMEIVSTTDFTKLNCTYKKKPDELADKILDYSDQIPALAARKLDVKLIFGRQISFAPQGSEIKKLKKPIQEIQNTTKNDPPKETQEKPVEKTQTPKEDPINKLFVADPNDKTIRSSFTVFAEKGEKFWMILNGEKVNRDPSERVIAQNLTEPIYRVKIIFQNDKIASIEDRLTAYDQKLLPYNNTYAIRANKNRYVIRTVSFNPADKSRLKEYDMMADDEKPQETKPVNNPTVTPKTEEKPKASVPECTSPMSGAEFNEGLELIKNQAFSETKMKVAKQFVSSGCVSLAQTRQLIAEFGFDDQKLEIATFAYQYSNERKRFFMLNDAFSFSGTKDKFNKFLEANK